MSNFHLDSPPTSMIVHGIRTTIPRRVISAWSLPLTHPTTNFWQKFHHTPLQLQTTAQQSRSFASTPANRKGPTMSVQGAVDKAKDAVQAVTDKVQEVTVQDGADKPALLLDEVTGEQVSKTELKKRQKAREKEAKKAEKDASRPAPAVGKAKKNTAEEDEGKLSPHVSSAALGGTTRELWWLTVWSSNTLRFGAGLSRR